MTTAVPQHARAGDNGRAWQRFRRWCRTRPFWGGLLLTLAGLEIFGSTRMTLNGLSFRSGSTGLLAWLIPVILVTCGLLLWFSPSQRLFYSIVAAVTTVYSLIGVNLGGFFVGLLLGLLGSALAFAWTPVARPAPTGAEADPGPGEPSRAEPQGLNLPDGSKPPVGSNLPDGSNLSDGPTLSDGPMPGGGRTAPLPRDDDPAPGGAAPAGYGDGGDAAPAPAPHVPPDLPGPRDPRFLAVTLVALSLSAAGLLAVHAPAPVRAAAPRCPTPSASATGDPSASRGPSATGGPSASASPSASAGPSAEAGRDSGGNLIEDIIEGIGDLFTGGRRERTDPPSASPTPTSSARPTGTPAPAGTPSATGRPSRGTGPGACPTPTPSRSGEVEVGQPLPRIAAEPGQPRVAQQPSKLTGSKVTMTGLRFEGIVELPTATGTLRALKFSMRKAVTEDFKLVADGPAGRNQQYVTDRLTVQGDVAFYSTRFVGRILGIKITLTPDLPFPDGIPITSPIPVSFTDPVIDLAFVTSDTLTARPALALSLT